MDKMNDDKIKEILFKHGLDKLLTEVKKHISDGYWQAYRDGYITGQGIGYQDGINYVILYYCLYYMT